MAAEIICIGQALADCIFRGWDKRSQLADSIDLRLGGDAFNKAVTAARLGHAVSLMAGVGDDIAGRALLSAAETEGILTSGCVISREHPTPVSALLVNDDGSRSSVLSAAHNIPFFTPSLVGADGARAVVLSSLFRPPFEDPAALLSLTRRARELGMTVYADVKKPKRKTFSLSEFSPVLRNTDYLFPNREEAEHYTGETVPERAGEAFLRTGVKNVIIKLGSHGALHMGENGTFRVPAWGAPVADAVGAGDAFASGFICGVLEGMDVRGSCELAAACAAICIGSAGAVSGLKSRAQVDLWLKAPPVPRL